MRWPPFAAKASTSPVLSNSSLPYPAEPPIPIRSFGGAARRGDWHGGSPVGSELAELERKQLLVEVISPLPRCYWDEERIASMLANLLDNALDHTRAGATIVLRLEERADEMVIQVEDSGAGIAAAELPHLFERFYRGRGRARKEGHAGLGLALVQEIVQRHGGGITVDSRLGEGTTFVIRLPVVVEQPSEAAVSA
ncbi:MAG: sensor histidine kinase [Chloroflexota bacterium]